MTTGWASWEYVVPTSGEYTICFHMGNGCQHGQRAEFDGVTVRSVPEVGSTALLTLLGLGVLLVSKSKNPRDSKAAGA